MQHRSVLCRKFLFTSIAAAVAASGGLFSAQTLAQGASALEEVVVTARKREESLQDIGQSVSAFSASEIEQRFASDISELTDVSPNLIVDDTAQGPGGVAAITMRGIGVSEVESSFDPAVGVVVDGVFMGKASGSITKAIDLERVEVLRGPQGTLFGRNAIGGVINLTRTKPTGEVGGKVRASYGNYDDMRFDGMLNFPLHEKIAIKLTGSYHDRDGYFSNLITGDDEGAVEYTGFGVNALFTPRDDMEIEYTYNRDEYDQDTPPLLNVTPPGQLFCDAFGFCAPDFDTPLGGDRFNLTQDGPNEPTSFEADTHIVELRWDFHEQYRLDYIFAYRETDEDVLQDFDVTPLTLFETSRPEKYDQTSHELRLTYSGERLSGTVGFYYWDSEYTIDLQSFIGFVVPNTVLTIPQTDTQGTESWAIFFEGDYTLPWWDDQVVLTFGGRYTDDEKSQQITNDPIISQPVPVKESWSEFTPKVGLKWFATDNAMLYFLYSSGYRSGGFNGRPTTQEAADLPYDPETVDNFEVGFKSEWFDNRLRFNFSFFHMEYDDKQEEQSVPVTVGTGQQTVVANAAAATIDGIEIDFTALPMEGLTIRGNLGWLDASFDDFIADIGRGGVTDNTDLNLRRAPDWNFALNATYEWQWGPGTAWVRGGWKFIGDHSLTLSNSPQTENDDQHLLDTSINYRYGKATFSLYGRNLLDEDGYTIGFDVGGINGLWTYATPRTPQTFGAAVQYEF